MNRVGIGPQYPLSVELSGGSSKTFETTEAPNRNRFTAVMLHEILANFIETIS